MKESDFQSLIDYVDNWNKIEDLKPVNEPFFIIQFLKLLENVPDEIEVTFDGDGSYFGKQVTLEAFGMYGRAPRQLRFEVAYSDTHIRVYTANHNGFWNPEFISIDVNNPDFLEFKSELYKFLTKTFGL